MNRKDGRPSRTSRWVLTDMQRLVSAAHATDDCCPAALEAMRTAWRAQQRHASGRPDHNCPDELAAVLAGSNAARPESRA